MPLASNLQFQDYQFKASTLRGTWKWTARVDVSQSLPVYEIRDIISPFGLLRDSIPIPGDIVEAMAESISDLKSAFAPNILLGPTAGLPHWPPVFTLNEGQGFGVAQPILVTNNGVFGSLLSVAITSAAPYMRVTPANLGNLTFNESGTFDIAVDSTNLLASESPYDATVTLQDPSAANNPQVLVVTVNVLPKAEIYLSSAALLFSVVKPGSGIFPPVPSQQFTLENTGPAGSVLDFTVQKLTGLSEWLAGFSPMTGSLASGGSQAITVLVQPPSNLLCGTYEETLRVSGYSVNSYVDILIQLHVT